MRFDRDERYGRHERLGGPEEPRGAYDADYAMPYRRAVRHGYGMGYAGGALRSRGSYQAGQLRSGLNPRDEFEFEWGEGYVGGRGYGGTNYDYEHGYRVGTRRALGAAGPPEAGGMPPRGYAWGDRRRGYGEAYGPSRYGYGPYHERLLRRRRSDDEIRDDVEDTLFYDTWVDADRIEVAVEDGVVTLRGTLPSYDEVRYAVDDAWDVDGVRGVRSELKVGQAARRGQEQPEAQASAAARAQEAPQPETRGAGRRAAPGGGGGEKTAGTARGTRSKSARGRGAKTSGEAEG